MNIIYGMDGLFFYPKVKNSNKNWIFCLHFKQSFDADIEHAMADIEHAIEIQKMCKNKTVVIAMICFISDERPSIYVEKPCKKWDVTGSKSFTISFGGRLKSL